MDELYAFWLQLACGICNHVYLTLFTRFASFREIYECEDFSFLEGKYKCVAALRDKNLGQAYELQKRCRSMNLHVIPYYDPRYPNGLRLIYAPPAILYGIGTLCDFNEMAGVAVVGTRHATKEGMQVTEDFAYYLAIGGATIVSGLAKGNDVCAHRGALRADGFTIAVLGTPIDEIYPKENARAFHTLYKRGLVLSEMYPGCKRSKADFPNRNRIISGISKAVLVTEAGEHSGALITARHAITQVRPLFAVPGPLGKAYAGNNLLIKRGVRVATDAVDILNELALSCMEIYPERIFSTPRIYAYGSQSPLRVYPTDDPLFDDDPEFPEPIFESPSPSPPKAQEENLPPEEKNTETAEPDETPCEETKAESILRALQERPLTADELTAKTGIGVSDLLVELTMLEVDGYLKAVPGNRFARTK